MSGHLLTVREVCARLGIAPSTFYARMADGTLAAAGLQEARRITRTRKFFAASVDRMLQPAPLEVPGRRA
jgi:predicted site-specific integrase-resolvase